MSFCIPVNIATAAMEDIYQRLCWVYTTMHNTWVYDHKCDSHHLSHLTKLFLEKIPYSEQFSKKPDYEQNSLIRDLRVKDILYTRTDWINQGMDPSKLEICQYADGEEKYVSIEGIPYRDTVHSWIPYKKGSELPTLSAGAHQSSNRGYNGKSI